MRLQGWEWIIILAIVLLLWGAPKLPALAKSAAQSMRIFPKRNRQKTARQPKLRLKKFRLKRLVKATRKKD